MISILAESTSHHFCKAKTDNLLYLLMASVEQTPYSQMETYSTFEEFYPYYLSQHSNQTCRRLHVVGSTLAFLQLLYTIFISFSLGNLLLVLIIGYGCAWVGHFFFEKNKPATFKYPFFSLRGDFRLVKETYTGERKF